MEYIALYRKWRPRSFDSLVGQEHVSRTLSQAIKTGKVGHAYLFSGPRGTGKTSAAKILAKALNCEKGPTPSPCEECASCRRINDGASMDVMEIDAASNRGIDEIRELRETVKFASVESRYRVYIIDEVHMLTTEAFNALLKTLEEPPPHVVFILATTEPQKVPATIKSRCQRYDFKRITAEDIAKRLRYVAEGSGIEADDDALDLVAVQADGGLRDALSLLDQCAALSDGRITREHVQEIAGLVGREWILRLARAIAEHSAEEVISIVATLLQDGKEARQILSELAGHMRCIMICQAAGHPEGMGIYAEPAEALEEQARLFPPERVPRVIERLHRAIGELKWSPQPRITAEIALLEIARSEDAPAADATNAGGAAAPREDSASPSRAELEVRVARLESMLARLAAAPPGAAAPSTPSSGASSGIATAKASPARASLPPSASAATPSTSGAASESIPPPTAEGTALWEQLLRTLKARSKQLQFTCLSQGRFEGMSESRFLVRFPSQILCNLASRNYRKVVEEVLAEISGRGLELVATAPAAAAPSPRPAVPRKKPEPKPAAPPGLAPARVDMEAMEPAERDRLQQAVDVFGDAFVEPSGEGNHK